MTKYIALFTGKGGGCDYTIECNKKFLVFDAYDDKEAIEECKKVWEDHGGDINECGIEKIQLFQASCEINVNSLINQWKSDFNI